MQSMPFHPRPRLAAALLAGLATAASAPSVLAETGGPLPQGYTSDVATSTQPAPQVQLVQQPPQVVQQAPVQQAPVQQAQPPADPGVDPADQYADTDPSALQDFREPLAPYGQWVQDPTYGTLWVPDPAQVGADFAPYQTAGQWTEADTGDWMWQSDYAWGYIPFHYGRWVWASNYWGWIPGRRYAPAWVTWRVGEGGYLGWAPLPPTWYWANGAAVRLYTTPWAAYCFVPTHYAFNRGVSAYVVRDRGLIGSIAAGTRPYHPSHPTIGAHVGSHYPASPTLSEAHIPASAAPHARVGADARAMAYATRSSTAAVRAGYAPHAGQGSASTYHGQGASSYRSYGGNGAYGGSYQRSTRSYSTGLRTPGSPAYSGPAYSAPAFHAPAYHTVHPAYGGAYHAPATSTHPYYSAPSSSSSHTSHSSGRSGGGGHHR